MKQVRGLTEEQTRLARKHFVSKAAGRSCVRHVALTYRRELKTRHCRGLHLSNVRTDFRTNAFGPKRPTRTAWWSGMSTLL